MIEISPDLISGKKVLLRYDIDVPLKKLRIENGEWRIKVNEDFRLNIGLETLRLCLEHAEQVVMMGHVGRPGGKEVQELSVEPIYDWLATHDDLRSHLTSGKLKLLENLRFEPGESFDSSSTSLTASAQDLRNENIEYAKKLAEYGDFYVNEAFAAHHPAASTTVLPTLLPHAAGLRFAEEVRVLRNLKENPKRSIIAIIGGAKVEDKYPAVKGLSSLFEYILVGGLLAQKIKEQNLETSENVILGVPNSELMDLSSESIEKFKGYIKNAKTVFWAGPVGKYEDPNGNRGNQELAQSIIDAGVDSIIGGGDTIAALSKFLSQFNFVSVGGGASLEFLIKGSLPTIEALK